MHKKQKLKNGVRLITAPLKETQTASLLVLVKVGSRQEDKKLEGVSHFIEHLMFKGTKKRPTTLDLSKELDGIGAEYNAYTGKDVTGYYIKTDSKHLSLAIDMLSDMLSQSLFQAEEIEKEKGVIVEEINMYEDNPLMYVEELLEEMLFDGGELGHMIAGSRETVKAMSREQILAYKKKYYAGANVVIGLAGKFNQSQLKELKAKFVFNKGSKSKIKKNPTKQSAPRVNLKNKATEQVQVALGFPAFSHHDKRSYALQLMSVILGGNMSSRLFINVREKKGLAYFVRAWPNLYEDAGAMVIQAGLDKSRIDEAIVTILGELNSMKAGVTTEELRRAKDFIAGKMALDLEDSMSIAQWYANLELNNKKLLTPQEKLKKIMAVKAEDVKQVAKDIFDFKRANLAVIGPFKDDKQFRKLLK